MGKEVQTDLPLDAGIHQHTNDREQRYSRNAFGFLQPHRGNGHGMLAPTNPGVSRGILIGIDLEHLGIRTSLKGHCCSEDGSPIGLLWVPQAFNLRHQAIAGLRRGWLHLRWTASVARHGWRVAATIP
jgi:hypothetical protein